MVRPLEQGRREMMNVPNQPLFYIKCWIDGGTIRAAFDTMNQWAYL